VFKLRPLLAHLEVYKSPPVACSIYYSSTESHYSSKKEWLNILITITQECLNK